LTVVTATTYNGEHMVFRFKRAGDKSRLGFRKERPATVARADRET